MVIVLMGVAGSGKTTIGRKLADALHWSFRDADEFHPRGNIDKMVRGEPLTDEDRKPWLAAIRTYIDECLSGGNNAVVTCSALRQQYRDALGTDRSEIRLVHLAGAYDVIRHRLEHRVGHFMKPDMLDSQFATLEAPRDVLNIDIAQSPDAIVAEIRAAFSV